MKRMLIVLPLFLCSIALAAGTGKEAKSDVSKATHEDVKPLPQTPEDSGKPPAREAGASGGVMRTPNSEHRTPNTEVTDKKQESSREALSKGQASNDEQLRTLKKDLDNKINELNDCKLKLKDKENNEQSDTLSATKINNEGSVKTGQSESIRTVFLLIVILLALMGLAVCLWLWYFLIRPSNEYHKTVDNFITQQKKISARWEQSLEVSSQGSGQQYNMKADLQSRVVGTMQNQNQSQALQAIPGQLKEAIAGLKELQRKADDFDKVKGSLDEYVKAYDNVCQSLALEQQASATLRSERGDLHQKWMARDSECKAATEAIARLEREKALEIANRDAVAKELAGLQASYDPLVAERNGLRGNMQCLTACLPVEDAECIYRAAMEQCAVPESAAANLRYLFSRLAVLASTRSLDVDASDKPILLRDAFNAFDMDLYARFKNDKALLQKLRNCFSEALKPLLAGAIAFEWPAPGDNLNLAKHKQETENGGEIIRDVKSAALFTGSGAVIAKAVVLT